MIGKNSGGERWGISFLKTELELCFAWYKHKEENKYGLDEYVKMRFLIYTDMIMEPLDFHVDFHQYLFIYT